MKYDLVVGLETHVELLTKTKIFCNCANKFGSEPNTNCCPICIGLPGTLPKINREVVNFAIRAALALNCEVSLVSKMDRKNYVYPDLPKAYQISQFYEPICKNGYIELDSGKKIRIHHIHMEEDAAKLVYKGGDTYVDYNRGGVPLLEVVTEPDISSSDEAREYLEKLQMIMRYIGVSDCRMQEGSIKCDVNVSVKPEGSEKLGTRTEIKNMNSITFMAKAIDYERERHIELIENGGRVEQQTLRYIPETNSTESMRSKEDAQDYRYFRDPDLVDIVLTKEQIDEIKSTLPELPDARFKKYVNEFGIAEKEAMLLVKYKNVSDYFEESINGLKNAKIVSNFIIGQIFRSLETEAEKEAFKILTTPSQMNELAKLIESGKLNMNLAKKALVKMLESGKPVTDFVSEKDMQGISAEEMKKLCEEAIKANENAVNDYRNGKEKALKALLGNVMKQTRGRGNAQEIEAMLKSIIWNNR